jgi:hypothetical protein
VTQTYRITVIVGRAAERSAEDRLDTHKETRSLAYSYSSALRRTPRQEKEAVVAGSADLLQKCINALPGSLPSLSLPPTMLPVYQCKKSHVKHPEDLHRRVGVALKCIRFTTGSRPCFATSQPNTRLAEDK